MRNFNRIFSEPENNPCATATEMPNKRPLQTSMSPLRFFYRMMEKADDQIGAVTRMLSSRNGSKNCVYSRTKAKPDVGKKTLVH